MPTEFDHLAELEQLAKAAELQHPGQQDDLILYSFIAYAGMRRAISLLEIAQLVPVEKRADLFRAMVVTLHAHLEDYLRSMGNNLLRSGDEIALEGIPLAGSDDPRRDKFTLSRLAQHRGKSVDEVIQASVTEFLDRQSFSNATEIISFIQKRLGIKLDIGKVEKDLAAIGTMIERRHAIVHRADRVASSYNRVGDLQTLTIDEVGEWAAATSRFMKVLLIAYLTKKYPDLPASINKVTS